MVSNSTNQPMRILVDADSCPVMEELSRAAEKFSVPVTVVTSLAHYGRKPEGFQVIYVDNEPQAADMEIMSRVSCTDIIVTGDYGLASLVLAKKARCLSPRGLVYTSENIERLLAERHVGAKIRRMGGRTKGPKPFTKEDKERFFRTLCRLIEGTIK